MPYKKEGTHKSTAMDSFAAPRAEGLIPQVLNNFGFGTGEGGRFAAGLKYDFVKAISNVTATSEADHIIEMIGSETARLQAERKTARPRKVMSEENIMEEIKAGNVSADKIEEMILKLKESIKK